MRILPRKTFAPRRPAQVLPPVRGDVRAATAGVRRPHEAAPGGERDAALQGSGAGLKWVAAAAAATGSGLLSRWCSMSSTLFTWSHGSEGGAWCALPQSFASMKGLGSMREDEDSGDGDSRRTPSGQA